MSVGIRRVRRCLKGWGVGAAFLWHLGFYLTDMSESDAAEFCRGTGEKIKGKRGAGEAWSELC